MEQEKEKVLKVVELIAREGKTKEGKKFTFYKAVTSTGKLIDSRFVRTVKDVPTTNCFAFVEPNKMNIDSNRKYPILWIQEVDHFQVKLVNNDEVDETISKLFSDDLPF